MLNGEIESLVNTWMSESTALDLAQHRHYFHLDFPVYLIIVVEGGVSWHRLASASSRFFGALVF
jgi:hypothetical protein